MTTINPQGWPRPRGYANGVLASGTYLAIAGQIGWNERGEFAGSDFLSQARQALHNVAAVLEAAGGRPQHVVRLTWYVTDKRAYLACARELGAAYKALFGEHYPAMTLVEVSALLEDAALVEIEATAVISS
ncbi:MAG TPA: RidA family protein [Verrucomicrobiae bacterium]|nr:RidA family protein [Verrucomicrobiae bacterium]